MHVGVVASRQLAFERRGPVCFAHFPFSLRIAALKQKQYVAPWFSLIVLGHTHRTLRFVFIFFAGGHTRHDLSCGLSAQELQHPRPIWNPRSNAVRFSLRFALIGVSPVPASHPAREGRAVVRSRKAWRVQEPTAFRNRFVTNNRKTPYPRPHAHASKLCRIRGSS